MRYVSLAFLLVACGSNAISGGSDMADLSAGATDMAYSICGHPGDVGNSLGVGKYCQNTVPDCSSNTKANICATAGEPHSFFCTFACHGDGGATECGDNAICSCAGSQCGCLPAACAGGSRDMAQPADMTQGMANCGSPGDSGNALGVGKYCTMIADCFSNSQAKICAVIGDPTAHFCTMQCTSGGSPTQCGDNATCQCGAGGCGCTPNICVGMPG
jgi:hypothetical protein